jgi:uncharacterized protein (DUF3084 family)
MKNRVGIIVLVLVGLGLGIALVTVKRQADSQIEAESRTILSLTNSLVETNRLLEEQKQVSALLEKDLDTQKKSFSELTNSYSKVSTDLAKDEVALEASQKEVARLEAKTADLEAQNQALDKHGQELAASITNLTQQIADTEKKLAASEDNKAFLESELKRMMAEKTELERQFNDLTVLRARVAKLKEEMIVAQRREWMRMGVFANAETKGAQKLMQGMGAVPGATTTAAAPAPKPAYDLNVEVTADGSVRVIPPITNAAAATNPPPK